MMKRREMIEAIGIGGIAAGVLGPAATAEATFGARSFVTRLTRRYGIQHAFMGAGMGFVSYSELVAAVSEAGGMGTIGAGIEPPPGVQILIAQAAAATQRPFGIDFGVVDTPMGPGTTDAHVAIAAAAPAHMRYVVFHFDLPQQHWVDMLHAAGKDVFCQVPSVEQARAARALGVDGIIAQGVEAGGHGRGVTPLHEMLRILRREMGSTLLIASGGITTSIDVLRAIVHGADGVWVGTRLVASHEAYAAPAYKDALVAAGRGSTVKTTMFGPELPGEPYRVLRNRVVNEWAGREEQIPNPPPPPATIGTTALFPKTIGPVPYPMPKFSAIVPTPETVGDFEEMGLPAGANVHRIQSVMPAGDIVREMMCGAWTRMTSLVDESSDDEFEDDF